MAPDNAAGAPRPARAKGQLGWTVRLLFAIGLIVLILHNLNLGEFQAVVVAPRWLPLVGMVVTALIFVLLGAVNIWIMLSALAPLQFVTVLRYYLVATAFGTFTPAGVGDFSLVAFLRREAVPVHRGLSIMLVDRGVTLTLYTVIYLPLTLLLVFATTQWLWLPVAFAIAVIGALAANLIASLRRWLLDTVVRRFLPRLEDFLRTCSDLVRFHPMYLLADVAVTVVRSVVAGVVIEMALWASGTHAGFGQVVVVTNSLSLLNFIPVSLSGVGVYEGGAVALFSQLGLSRERVFAAFVFHRIYMLLFAMLMLAVSRLLLRCGSYSEVMTEAEVKP